MSYLVVLLAVVNCLLWAPTVYYFKTYSQCLTLLSFFLLSTVCCGHLLLGTTTRYYWLLLLATASVYWYPQGTLEQLQQQWFFGCHLSASKGLFLSGLWLIIWSHLCLVFCAVSWQHLIPDPTPARVFFKSSTNYYLSLTLRPTCSPSLSLLLLLLSASCCELLVSLCCLVFGGVVAIAIVAILDSVIDSKPPSTLTSTTTCLLLQDL